ncbi:uncharacterized protein PODANS_7_4860 [Podospora anserina S mat+]|uniref:Podospora anserina S mat+ genomic DNA chromosome 7, supercontig 1 n=1 Tax=Podospora anserina (strain S / ATCC MYA-4624 / DSM 980 / FGSC 10383) TaxID=515849 RepID=B2AUW7_PODAN|nr:uncharacterized protein PODANS_7_4860 [Podospora anserina S mat+]CAP68190.1 unnamed protein product [Podospora anserina S mat+]CDP31660.1 Putative trichothecene 3-O-acetyltransferase [Podospora anserina S mat+]
MTELQNSIIQLRPKGWEADPEHEYFNLSTLDYCVGQVYTNYALFFKLSPNADKSRIISTIKDGLEVTLSQCRQLCGTLQEQPSGGGDLCFHKTRDSTVEFHVQFLDTAESKPEGEYQTFGSLEAQHFASRALGNMKTWCVSPMTYGEKPEAQPSSHPKCAAFKITFIPGGFLLMMHHHHYANDIMGWAGELHQLAENCATIWDNPSAPALPPWDPSCLDLSRITAPNVPEDKKIDGPASPLRHPDHKKAQWLLFHLSKTKTAALKQLASPKDGSYYVSSYDAYNALIWRLLTKHRLALFADDVPSNTPMVWGEAVDMRRRFTNPPIAPRTQGNVVYVALSSQSPPELKPLAASEVASDASLEKLAWYIRQLTNSVTQESLAAALNGIAPIRDKTALFLRVDSLPPLSIFVTEWRDTRPCDADFGFGKPHAFRFPFDTITNGLVVVYPVRGNGPCGDDEGNEFSIAVEMGIKDSLLADEEWNSWFDFRGVDADDMQRD